MTAVNRRYFEALMADKKLSLRGLAAKMGLNHSQLSLMLSGTRRLQLDEAAQISQIFGVPIAQVVEAAGVAVRPLSGSRVSVVGVLNGDGTVTMHGSKVIERTTAPEEVPDDSIAIQARTAGTKLELFDAAVFFCRAHNGVDPAILGRFCLAQIEGGPTVMAAVRRGYTAATYNLIGLYQAESARLAWATPVLLTRH